MLERLRRFQEALVEIGVARSILALPAPKTLLLEDKSSTDAGHTTLFSSAISEPEIASVSRDLFASGFYNLAVAEAYKALDNYVRDRMSASDSGSTLMERVFSVGKPQLQWTSRTTASEKNQHSGYSRLFSGAMIGIRNPTTHEFDWITEPEEAIELIVFAQHLLRKAKAAQEVTPK